MFSHIKTYAFTKKAFKALLPEGNADAPEFPNLWFDWEMPDLHGALGRGATMRRIAVVNDTRYDAAKQQWVADANSRGILPVLVATVDDAPPSAEWPSARPQAFRRPIKCWPNDDDSGDLSWYPIEDSEGKVVAIVPLDARDEHQLSAFRDELALPEQAVLGAWVGVATNDKEEFWEIEAHPAAWSEYARGLKQWVGNPGLEEKVLQPLGEAPYHLWNTAVQLGWDDFTSRPSLKQVRESLEETLIIPCKWLPFCGIGLENGRVTTFGLLPVNGDSSWPFGDALRVELLSLLESASQASKAPRRAPALIERAIDAFELVMEAVRSVVGPPAAGGHVATQSLGYQNQSLRGVSKSELTTRQAELLFECYPDDGIVQLIREPVGTREWVLRLDVQPEALRRRVTHVLIDGTAYEVDSLKTIESTLAVKAKYLRKEVKCRISRD